MKKTVITGLLAAGILFGLAPSAAAAGEPVVRDAFAYDDGLVILMSDGTVRVEEDERFSDFDDYASFTCEECTGWTDIVQICASDTLVVGLRSDGTVVAEGPAESVSELSKWEHITKFYTLRDQYDLVAGLQENGDLLILDPDRYENVEDESDFVAKFYNDLTAMKLKDIRKLEIGLCPAGAYAAALYNDGTVSSLIYDMGWSGPAENVVDLACSGWSVIALKEDGTCVVNGLDSGFRTTTDLWVDLKQVECGDTLALGLYSDGTIATTRDDDCSLELLNTEGVDHFTCSVYNQIVAYRADGTVECFRGIGDSGDETVRGWKDIDRVLMFEPFIIALKTDGTLISTED